MTDLERERMATLETLALRVAILEGRFDERVSKEVYQRDLKEIHADIGEIKDAQRWANRLIIAQFLALMVGLILFLVTQAQNANFPLS